MGNRKNIMLKKDELKNFCTYRLLFGISYSLMVPVMPLFFDSLGISTVVIGTIVSLYGISEMLTQIPFGILSESIGDTLALKIAIAIIMFIPLGYTFINNGFLAGSLYVIQGGIFGMVAPATFSILARSVDERRRGQCTGFASAVFTFGGGVGAAIAGFIVSKLNSYNLVFYLSSIGISITLVYVMLKIKRDKPRKMVRGEDDTLIDIFREIKRKRLTYKIIVISGIAFLGDYIYGCIITLFHFYGKDVLGASTAYTSSIISIYLIVFGLGAPVAGWISDKIGNKKQILLSFIIMNLSLIVLVITRDIKLFTVFIIVYFIGSTFLNAVFQSSLSEFGNEYKIKGFVFGFVGALESLGFALGPLISAFLYDINKSFLFPGLLAVSSIVTFLYIIFIKKIRL
ncbi:hypothetical protein HMPREF1092_01736 [Clostridium thermobutyricum]|uniref:Major facilitator superfamily (MFS) profile domain-containing protein n=1 Tax=Clostridium thermobutyricum TaxID=29372 RepID=N9WHD7_9CLOT|nr:MFS transporter [Clostridium thermobutyricum]ENZ02501.1 hypothetical protein HMPREF1092_01736 [Clostridium thermobutyricum]